VHLPPADRKELLVESQANVIVLAIVTLPRSRDEMPTANLQGPLAINVASRRGKQLAISESPFGIRCPIDLTREP
jgi:flagellar assembly factor FliW